MVDELTTISKNVVLAEIVESGVILIVDELTTTSVLAGSGEPVVLIVDELTTILENVVLAESVGSALPGVEDNNGIKCSITVCHTKSS